MNESSDSFYSQFLSYTPENPDILNNLLFSHSNWTIVKNTLPILISLIHSALTLVYHVTLLSNYSLYADHFLSPPWLVLSTIISYFILLYKSPC